MRSKVSLKGSARTKTCTVFLAALAIVGATAQQPPKPRTAAEFFDAFTDEWMRANLKNVAAATRYFSGDQQDAIEQQVAPEGVLALIRARTH